MFCKEDLPCKVVVENDMTANSPTCADLWPEPPLNALKRYAGHVRPAVQDSWSGQQAPKMKNLGHIPEPQTLIPAAAFQCFFKTKNPWASTTIK